MIKGNWEDHYFGCEECENTGWLCEEHPLTPFDACSCGGAGRPCECNIGATLPDDFHVRKAVKGTKIKAWMQ